MLNKIRIGITLIVTGLFIVLSDFIAQKREIIFSYMNTYLYKEKESEKKENKSTLNIEISNTTDYKEYMGILSIPKINFHKGFYESSSQLNNVRNNIYLLPESNSPDILNGNVIIAGHSGNYTNSYFQNVYKLVIGDLIIIDYKGKLYKYKIMDIYDIEKNGKAKIIRDEDKTTVTLITCKNGNNKLQTVYIGYLV